MTNWPGMDGEALAVVGSQSEGGAMKWSWVLLYFILFVTPSYATVRVKLDPQATPREIYGASKLTGVLESRNFRAPANPQVIAAVRTSSLLAGYPSLPQFATGDSEAFHILRVRNTWLVVGSDPSGVLYGCLELARIAKASDSLPKKIDMTDRPALHIRGTNLFWMKRGRYNWEVTPENFPWFFDRVLMLRYLDELVRDRYNTLVFWNGHPFPYFLELSRYPEARVLNDSDLRRNIEYFKWFTQEADRRGLWTVFHFYNIHVSPSFAKAHGKEGVNEENPESTPLLAAYMRYCVSEFVDTYPSVGLMLTAGEALHVKAEEYVRDVIIAGIKDTGKNPPLIVRQWTIDPYRFRDTILPNYDNLFTMMKHNTEMLVSPFPDARNKIWASFGKNHIVNLHELGDVKPFRWGSPVWIDQAVQNWKSLGFSGFHVYPMTSWMWPTTLDRTDPLLNVIDRDAIWTDAFGRYGWQPNRPPAEEEAFWKARLSERFGSATAGNAIYTYYVKTGPVLPGFQNMVNIYNMNHFPTAVSEEASLDAILHSQRWGDSGDYLARPLDEVTLQAFETRFGNLPAEVRSQPPLSVRDYLQPHSQAIEPLPLADTLVSMAENSLAGLEAANGTATTNNDEFARFTSDNLCILYLARFYRAKIAAAIAKGKFDASGNFAEYDTLLAQLEQSVIQYRKLEEIATQNYRQASDLGEWHSWTATLKSFEDELSFYRDQHSLSAKGAELVYLGLDGQMNNASNAFHWLLEYARQQAHWASQSYAFGDSPFQHAKLVVVYDLGSPEYQRKEKQLQAWVEHGGRLLLWDVKPSVATPPFLEGLLFRRDSSHEAPDFVGFRESTSPLLLHLSGSKQDIDAHCGVSPNIAGTSQDWQELAYTVVSTANLEQIQWGYGTFGPRWSSLLNSDRRPVLLTKKIGKGEVLLAELGSCNILPKSGMSTGQEAEAPAYLREFVQNLLNWAETRAVNGHAESEKQK